MKAIKVFYILIITLITQSVISQTLDFDDGVNIQPSYYNNGNVDIGWNHMKKFKKIK